MTDDQLTKEQLSREFVNSPFLEDLLTKYPTKKFQPKFRDQFVSGLREVPRMYLILYALKQYRHLPNVKLAEIFGCDSSWITKSKREALIKGIIEPKCTITEFLDSQSEEAIIRELRNPEKSVVDLCREFNTGRKSVISLMHHAIENNLLSPELERLPRQRLFLRKHWIRLKYLLESTDDTMYQISRKMQTGNEFIKDEMKRMIKEGHVDAKYDRTSQEWRENDEHRRFDCATHRLNRMKVARILKQTSYSFEKIANIVGGCRHMVARVNDALIENNIVPKGKRGVFGKKTPTLEEKVICELKATNDSAAEIAKRLDEKVPYIRAVMRRALKDGRLAAERERLFMGYLVQDRNKLRAGFVNTSLTLEELADFVGISTKLAANEMRYFILNNEINPIHLRFYDELFRDEHNAADFKNLILYMQHLRFSDKQISSVLNYWFKINEEQITKTADQINSDRFKGNLGLRIPPDKQKQLLDFLANTYYNIGELVEMTGVSDYYVKMFMKFAIDKGLLADDMRRTRRGISGEKENVKIGQRKAKIKMFLSPYADAIEQLSTTRKSIYELSKELGICYKTLGKIQKLAIENSQMPWFMERIDNRFLVVDRLYIKHFLQTSNLRIGKLAEKVGWGYETVRREMWNMYDNGEIGFNDLRLYWGILRYDLDLIGYLKETDMTLTEISKRVDSSNRRIPNIMKLLIRQDQMDISRARLDLGNGILKEKEDKIVEGLRNRKKLVDLSEEYGYSRHSIASIKNRHVLETFVRPDGLYIPYNDLSVIYALAFGNKEFLDDILNEESRKIVLDRLSKCDFSKIIRYSKMLSEHSRNPTLKITLNLEYLVEDVRYVHAFMKGLKTKQELEFANDFDEYLRTAGCNVVRHSWGGKLSKIVGDLFDQHKPDNLDASMATLSLLFDRNKNKYRYVRVTEFLEGVTLKEKVSDEPDSALEHLKRVNSELVKLHTAGFENIEHAKANLREHVFVKDYIKDFKSKVMIGEQPLPVGFIKLYTQLVGNRLNAYLNEQVDGAFVNKSLVHGDLHPENLMIEDDKVCLIDFELSYHTGIGIAQEDLVHPMRGIIARGSKQANEFLKDYMDKRKIKNRAEFIEIFELMEIHQNVWGIRYNLNLYDESLDAGDIARLNRKIDFYKNNALSVIKQKKERNWRLFEEYVEQISALPKVELEDAA